MADSITLNPIGLVVSTINNRDVMPTSGVEAAIRVFPPFVGALERIEEYSHLWILTWLHEASRDVTTAVPAKVNPYARKFGVFALRSPARPNPIALTLVKLERIQDNILFVSGMDAVDGSPVLDIKPYFEHDIVFSPRSPQITPLDDKVLKDTLLNQALTHHGEVCPDLLMAVRMAAVADKLLGYIKSPKIQVQACGSACFADSLQGLCRAKLANPARFEYWPSSINHSNWSDGIKRLSVIGLRELDLAAFWELPDTEVFEVILEEIE